MKLNNRTPNPFEHIEAFGKLLSSDQVPIEIKYIGMSSTEKQILIRKRNQEIASLYCAGKTLEGAGAPFGLKKERVRQILLRQGIVERRFWSKPQPTLEEKRKIKELKFWSRVALTADPDRCWDWQGYVDRAGYGKSSWYGAMALFFRPRRCAVTG